MRPPVDTARQSVLLARVVKRFKTILASIMLVAFGGTFATVEAHGASMCSEETMISAHNCGETAELAPEQSSEDQHSGKSQSGCHCPNSANCSFLMGAVLRSSYSLFLTETLTSDDQRPTDTARDGPARPPRT